MYHQYIVGAVNLIPLTCKFSKFVLTEMSRLNYRVGPFEEHKRATVLFSSAQQFSATSENDARNVFLNTSCLHALKALLKNSVLGERLKPSQVVELMEIIQKALFR